MHGAKGPVGASLEQRDRKRTQSLSVSLRAA